jgi:hypothetical protein
MARPQAKTTQRGYGSPHQKERARWQPVVAAGQAWCAETACLEPSRWIAPGSTWHLAHDTGQDGYRGPAHQRCNIAEANRRRAARRRKPARRRRASAAAGRVPAAAMTAAPSRTSRRW